MASQSGVLYIGMTNDLFCRVSQHKSKTIPGFSQTYNTTKLVYFEPSNSHHKLNNKLPAPISTTSETCHPDRSNPTWQDLFPKLIPTTN